jgi:hypothetical protein
MKLLCVGRETRKSPIEVCTSAAPPVANSGELVSMATVMAPLTRVPDTIGRAGALLGDVGLPPHASSIAPPQIASVTARAQNVRREGLAEVVSSGWFMGSCSAR